MPATDLQGKTTQDEMREAFEVWCVSEGYCTEKYASGKYAHPSTTTKWRAWQAAWKCRGEQDALICELYAEANRAYSGTLLQLQDCASAIRSGASHD